MDDDKHGEARLGSAHRQAQARTFAGQHRAPCARRTGCVDLCSLSAKPCRRGGAGPSHACVAARGPPMLLPRRQAQRAHSGGGARVLAAQQRSRHAAQQQSAHAGAQDSSPRRPACPSRQNAGRGAGSGRARRRQSAESGSGQERVAAHRHGARAEDVGLRPAARKLRGQRQLQRAAPERCDAAASTAALRIAPSNGSAAAADLHLQLHRRPQGAALAAPPWCCRSRSAWCERGALHKHHSRTSCSA
jgi:hypothetical protein